MGACLSNNQHPSPFPTLDSNWKVEITHVVVKNLQIPSYLCKFMQITKLGAAEVENSTFTLNI